MSNPDAYLLADTFLVTVGLEGVGAGVELDVAASTTPISTTSASTSTKVSASQYAASFDKSLAGAYKTTANLNMRDGAGTSNKVLTVLKKGTTVRNYGYYTTVNGTKWLYVQVTVDGVQYTGFCSGKYLQK